MANIWKTGGYFFPLLYICLLCDEVLLPCNFRSPGFDVRIKLKNFLSIASLFHMYIDMDERIAGKQDRPSLIIEEPTPLRAPK